MEISKIIAGVLLVLCIIASLVLEGERKTHALLWAILMSIIVNH